MPLPFEGVRAEFARASNAKFTTCASRFFALFSPFPPFARLQVLG